MLNVKVFVFFGFRRNPTFAHSFSPILSSSCAIQTDNIISTGWIAHTITQAYMNLSKSKVALFKIEAHKLKAPPSLSLSLSLSIFLCVYFIFLKSPAEDVIRKMGLGSGL